MVVAESMKNKELADLSFFETTGFSMWPFLKAGEKLLIKKTPTENLKVGDIIIYRGDNQLVCHRLIKKIKQRERYLLYVCLLVESWSALQGRTHQNLRVCEEFY